MLHIRHYEPKDYDMVSSWWRGHGFPVIHPSALPATGLIASDGETCFAAAWLMLDNSCGFAMVAWAVTNPGNGFGQSHQGLSLVAECLIEHAKAQGYGAILNSCTQDSIAKVFNRKGFKTIDREVIHQIAILEPCHS